MKQGKFEAPRGSKPGITPQKPTKKQEPAPEKQAAKSNKQKPKPSGKRRRRDWLLILLPLVVLAVAAGAVLMALHQQKLENAHPEGMTREALLEHYGSLARELEQREMVLTLRPKEPDSQEQPVVLQISPAQSRVRVDLTGLESDLEEGVGRVSRRLYVLDPKAYISLDRSALRELAEQTAQEHGQEFMESSVEKSTQSSGEEQVEQLTLNIGCRGRNISAEEIYNSLLDAYYSGNLAPELEFETKAPESLDPMEIWSQYTTPPVNAVMNESSFAISQEIPGYGFTRQELEELLDRAEEGKDYVLRFHTLDPEITAADLEASLYADVLGEAHTPHSWVDDRTVNLMLACAAIDGTVLMPGQVFSFNQVVGERTEAKGYREATAYVGGASVPEIGGGVCQVASSIYYAVLQADLRTVERHAHTYLVTYVPQGMDAAIYWGTLDYKFENNSPYPIKIQAGVSDGDVHIVLWGTEWKDYRVNLSYEILDETPWETKEQYVYDGSYSSGETIVTPYTGYRIATYRTVVDAQGNTVETTKIATSHYEKRDKVIAVIPPQPQPTEPPQPEPTESAPAPEPEPEPPEEEDQG